MAKEIEYKFLIKDKKLLFSEIENITPFKIEQGYLNTDPHKTVRVRIKDDTAFLTIKGINEGISRNEYEYEIPLQDGKDMLSMCHDKVSKTRYKLPTENGLFWEIDFFHEQNEGLVLAELEVPDESTIFNKPSWVGDDVTLDHNYSNNVLAQKKSSHKKSL